MSDSILLLRLEHNKTAKLLDYLEEQVRGLHRGEEPDSRLRSLALQYLQTYPDQCHHPKEDLIFKALAQRDPAAAEALGDLGEEHEKLTALTTEVAALDRRGPSTDLREGLERLVAGYRRHIDMEEREFVPAALEALGHGDWATIDFELFDRDDPLFDHAEERRYTGLRREIDRLAESDHRKIATRQEAAWLQRLQSITQFNEAMSERGSPIRLTRFSAGGYGVERLGELLSYIPPCNQVPAIWCAYFFAKGAGELDEDQSLG